MTKERVPGIGPDNQQLERLKKIYEVESTEDVRNTLNDFAVKASEENFSKQPVGSYGERDELGILRAPDPKFCEEMIQKYELPAYEAALVKEGLLDLDTLKLRKAGL